LRRRGSLSHHREDGFWGIAGYDYLYWLSFFNNRKWLTRAALAHAPLAHADAVALLVVILVLKAWLAVCNGSYRRHSLSPNQRLREAINLE